MFISEVWVKWFLLYENMLLHPIISILCPLIKIFHWLPVVPEVLPHPGPLSPSVSAAGPIPASRSQGMPFIFPMEDISLPASPLSGKFPLKLNHHVKFCEYRVHWGRGEKVVPKLTLLFSDFSELGCESTGKDVGLVTKWYYYLHTRRFDGAQHCNSSHQMYVYTFVTVMQYLVSAHKFLPVWQEGNAPNSSQWCIFTGKSYNSFIARVIFEPDFAW